MFFCTFQCNKLTVFKHFGVQKIVFENLDNSVLILSNYFGVISVNLMLFLFFKTQKIEIKLIFSVFLYFS